MKKTITSIVLVLTALLVAVVFTGCIHVDLGNLRNLQGIVGNGVIETREVAITGDLTGLRNMGSFEVTIDPALTGKATLEGEQNILDLVEASQNSQGVFTVSTKPGAVFVSARPVKVRVPVVKSGVLEVAGSGNITLAGSNPLVGDRFDLAVNGSGNIDVSLTAQAVTAAINGSGDIKALGTTGTLKVNINGSGNFNGNALKSATADVQINGSGSANVFASEAITGDVFGSGDVNYSGDPAKVQVSEHGSGDVNKR